MLREVKIHNSALLPKVQFNPERKGRAGGEGGGGGGGRAHFYDRLLVLIWSCKLGECEVLHRTPPKHPNSALKLENDH